MSFAGLPQHSAGKALPYRQGGYAAAESRRLISSLWTRSESFARISSSTVKQMFQSRSLTKLLLTVPLPGRAL